MFHFLKMGFPTEWDLSGCTHAIMQFLVPKRVCRGRYNTIFFLPKIGKNDVSHLYTAILKSCVLYIGRCSRQLLNYYIIQRFYCFEYIEKGLVKFGQVGFRKVLVTLNFLENYVKHVLGRMMEFLNFFKISLKLFVSTGHFYFNKFVILSGTIFKQ